MSHKFWGCLAGPRPLQQGLPCVSSCSLCGAVGQWAGFLKLSGFQVRVLSNSLSPGPAWSWAIPGALLKNWVHLCAAESDPLRGCFPKSPVLLEGAGVPSQPAALLSQGWCEA